MGELDRAGAGAAPTRFCHSCGTRLSEPIGRFCQSCGAEVGPAPDPDRTPAGERPSSPEPSRRRPPLLWGVALIALAAAAVAVVLLGGGSDSSEKTSGGSAITTLPGPSELPPQTVALVTHLPAEAGTVTRAELNHAITQSAAQSAHASPAPGSPEYDETAESALTELLDGLWIQGEAAELGLDVTPREVSEERAKIKRQSFKSDGEYRRFLAKSHYTEEDVRQRVKEQILSTKIQNRVEKQENLSEFVTRYSARWRARTVCLPRYAVEHCSNGPDPAQASKSGKRETTLPANP